MADLTNVGGGEESGFNFLIFCNLFPNNFVFFDVVGNNENL